MVASPCQRAHGVVSETSVAHLRVTYFHSQVNVAVPLRPEHARRESLHRERPLHRSGSGVDVRVITTNSATHFYNIAEIPVRVYTDKDEWEMWTTRSDPVLHIELRRWANLLVIAPLDANTLGKIASGICDNLLTCVVRAWDMSCPLLFCPAMNTSMWQHPITAQQVATLQHFGYVEIPCIAKKLVCGDEGKGAMAEVSTIVDMVQQYLPKPNVSSHK
uniref:Phosphopantothenoylcysteine decarboxylase n=1 Tax=Electrophorus electricus TaxID=8005 RepID=A0A4W4HHI7_ELEEL